MKPFHPSSLLVVCLFFIASTAMSQRGQQVLPTSNRLASVKVFVSPRSAERREVIELLQLDHFIERDGAIQAEISQEDLAVLKSSRFRHEILVADVPSHLENLNRVYFEGRRNGTLDINGRPTVRNEGNRLVFEETGSIVENVIFTPSAFEVKPTFGGYYSFAEMVTAMDNLVAAYPSIAQKISLGSSFQGRTLWCIKISDNVATDESNEPEVLFMGLQHAREAIGGSSMIFFMQYLCEGYGVDTRIAELVNNREIYIIPCLNPDGWEYNRTTTGVGGMWRKNRRGNGTDLNRNWSVDWANCSSPIQGPSTSCGSPTSTSETYYGSSAFSEPETQAIRDFTYTRHFVTMIDQHSYGPYYSLPFGRPSLHSFATDPIANLTDSVFYVRLAAAMGTYNGMRSGNSYEALDYEVAGGVKDWMLKGNIGTGTKGKVYGMTGEGSAGGGVSGNNFWAPAGEIVRLCKGMAFQNLQLLYASGSYVDLQDASDINLSSQNGSLSFTATRIGLDNQQVNVSIIPLENISSVGSTVSFNLANYGDVYNGNISYTLPAALTAGQRVRFAWRIQTGGITYYDTVVKFYSATQLLYDNMNGTFATNWTGTGSWNRTSAGLGFGGGTSRAISESPSGNYSSNSNSSCTYNGTFNLSDATAAYLSFWVRHRAENFHDKLQVQVSRNGSSWDAIAGSTTIQEPGTLDGSTINGQPALTGVKIDWTRELFDLSNYLGESALRLRFVFTSDGTNSFAFAQDDGFYIDELKVIKSTSNLITLPVNFTDFTAKLRPDNTVRLDWQATVDAKHSHFIVERSTDGQHFNAIGRVDNGAYTLVDPNPVPGINYYRIRQYDIDGNFTYSKVNAVLFSKASFALYPNPAAEKITIRFNSANAETISLQVTDLSGRMVYSKQVAVASYGQEIQVDVRSWSSQTYIVKAIRPDNSILAVQKFIRQ